jgi:hypothetical protein
VLDIEQQRERDARHDLPSCHVTHCHCVTPAAFASREPDGAGLAASPLHPPHQLCDGLDVRTGLRRWLYPAEGLQHQQQWQRPHT